MQSMSESQDRFNWPDRVLAGVSLTFDGALPSHTQAVLPALNALDLRATFFLSPAELLNEPVAWKRAVLDEHQIGNHSLSGVTDDGRLPNWTLEMVSQDLRMTQKLIDETLATEPSVFAVPGPDPTCAEGNYLPVVDRWFEISRTSIPGINLPTNLNLQRLRSIDVRGLPMSALTDLASDVQDVGGWLVLKIDEIEPVHSEFIDWLAGMRSELWTATIAEIANHLTSRPAEVR